MKFTNMTKISLLTMMIFSVSQAYSYETSGTKNNMTNNATMEKSENKSISDREVTKNVEAKLAEDKITNDLKLHVITNKGVVELSGNVNTDAEASKVIQLVESTPGVKDTNTSKLTIKESTQPFTDMTITAKVKGTFIREKLFGEKNVPLMSINVETTDGVVYLTGTVETKDEADNAVNLAKSIGGVKSVEPKLDVKPAN